MKNEILFLRPVFHDRIWGGTALKEAFDYHIPTDKTGECWAISAHPNGMGVIANGRYKGKTLAELWNDHRELFGNIEGEQFPLLTKILDASADLSVQVHPNDEYAREFEQGELGKTECWYIIDCDQDAEMIFGHHAKTRVEVNEMIEKGEWSTFLRRIKIKPGDFFYVPSGTVHAICKGTLVLETQQSSDTTYRLYDYDRVDAQGIKRQLHLKKSIDVMTVPFKESELNIEVTEQEGATLTTYVQSDYFSVHRYDIQTSLIFNQDYPFLMVSVLSGSARLNEIPIKKGDHFILPADFGEVFIKGEINLMIAHL